MSAQALPLQEKPMSQVARVADTYVAPSKTFTDIPRSSNCWLALVLYVLVWIPFGWSAGKTVGWPDIATREIQSNHFTRDQFDALKPEQRPAAIHRSVISAQVSTYGRGAFGLIFLLIMALILWGSFNFGLGAATKFGQVFAVVLYSTLPQLFVPLISIVLLLMGVGTENFDTKNPAGTNIGYYLTDSPKWMQAAGQFFDVFGLWSLALMTIGMAIISRKKTSLSALVVVGWWALFLVLVSGLTAAFS